MADDLPINKTLLDARERGQREREGARPRFVATWVTDTIRVYKFDYEARARAVYWKPRKVEACLERGGPDKAQCLLSPKHDGPHYGNGFDEWGPKGPVEWGGK